MLNWRETNRFHPVWPSVSLTQSIRKYHFCFSRAHPLSSAAKHNLLDVCSQGSLSHAVLSVVLWSIFPLTEVFLESRLSLQDLSRQTKGPPKLADILGALLVHLPYMPNFRHIWSQESFFFNQVSLRSYLQSWLLFSWGHFWSSPVWSVGSD